MTKTISGIKEGIDSLEKERKAASFKKAHISTTTLKSPRTVATSQEADEWMKNYKDGDPIPNSMRQRVNGLLKNQCQKLEIIAQKFKTLEK